MLPDEELPEEASDVAKDAVEDAGKPEPDISTQSGGDSPPEPPVPE